MTMEAERVTIDVERTADGFFRACATVQKPDSTYFHTKPATSRDRNRAISYALVDAALAFERGEVSQ